MTAQSVTALQQTRGAIPVRQSYGSRLDQFDELYSAISRRAFELFQNNGQSFGHELDDWLHAESELLHPVHLNVTESDDEFTVLAEVPGFTSKDLDIRAERKSLTITGKRELKEGNHGKKIVKSTCSDQILRTIGLPVEVDPSRASATVNDGILSITLPKAANAKAARVEPKPA